MHSRSALLLFALLCFVGAAGAAHITDKLAVGLYDTPKRAGEPARVLISGTPVEILQRNDRFCEVRLGDGQEGWLECRYASDEKPARSMLVEAQADNGQLRKQLVELERQLEEKQLRLQELELRMQAAEQVVEQTSPAAAATGNPPRSAEQECNDSAATGPGLLPIALAGGGGFLLGALLLGWYWRQRVDHLRF